MNNINFINHSNSDIFSGLNDIQDQFSYYGIDIILLNKLLLSVVLNKNIIGNDNNAVIYINVDQIYNKLGKVMEVLKNSNFKIFNVDSTYKNFKLEVIKHNRTFSILGLYKNKKSIRRKNQRYPYIYFNNLKTITFNEMQYKIPFPAEGFLDHLFGDWNELNNNIDALIEKKISDKISIKTKVFNTFTDIRKAKSIIENRIYNKNREPLFLNMLDNAMCEYLSIIEIGSSNGIETEHIIQKHSNKNLSLYLVEPDKENLDKAKKKTGLNNQIKYFNFGISNKEEINYFYKSIKKPNLNSAIPSRYSTEKIKVRYTTIDKFIKENNISTPLLLKMDIEGFEVEVLEGFLEFAKINQNIKILMEIHPNTYSPKHSLKRVLEKLYEYGFKFKYIESAGNPRPKMFTDRGYMPVKIAKNRGLYKNIDPEFAINVISKNISDHMKDASRLTLKIVRSVLLEKT